MKSAIFRLLGKDPEPVVASFCSGPRDLAERMVQEIRQLVPELEHFAVTREPIDGTECVLPEEAGTLLRRKRIAIAPTLFFTGPDYDDIRRLAFRIAPRKILAYNTNLERHHLKLSEPIASWLFLRGVPLDRIWLRPTWFPLRREHSERPASHVVVEGRQTNGRPRVAILSPYFPYPLSHGGAVRIFNLLRECAREFDIFLFAFSEDPENAAYGTPVLDYCAKVVLFRNPRYREPRWSSIDPPEVCEFTSDYVLRTLRDFQRIYDLQLLQVEYTQMASYGGTVLVEHDVTFDLYDQLARREQTVSSRWNLWRWRRFEQRAVRRYERVVVMSARDQSLLPSSAVVVIPNGVDLDRFRPAPQSHERRLLFVGSFAHFPNVVAFRWLLENVMPLLPADVAVTVIAGRNHELYWREPLRDQRIELYGFISDVRPYYEAAAVVVVPTQVSAGTNLKVIEAMAMERSVVSTSSGVNGIEVHHGQQVLIADSPAAFAGAILELLDDGAKRAALASRARQHAEEHYGWDRIGRLQRALWRDLLLERSGIRIREGKQTDVAQLQRIQAESHGASQWEPETYFTFRVRVAEWNDRLAGFLVSRIVGPGEAEILNVAVAPEARKRGIASALLESLTEPDIFLEVRKSNYGAQALYRKLGFEVVGERPDYYDDPVETALVMRRTVRGPAGK